MNDTLIHAAAKFFFLTLKDHRMSHEATKRTLIRINKTLAKNQQDENWADFVRLSYKYWKAFSKTKTRFYLFSSKMDDESLVQENKLYFPKDLNMGSWNQFLRDADEEELLLVTFSKILNISDSDIARGLGLTEGTVRYRISNGLKKLGKSLAS